MATTGTATNKSADVVFVDEREVKVRFADGDTKSRTWRSLRDASYNNGDLTDFYAGLLKQATDKALQMRPTEIGWGEYNTNVFGVFGKSIDGKFHGIRAFDFQGMKLRADEGLDLYAHADAEKEAKDIAKTNGITFGGRIRQ